MDKHERPYRCTIDGCDMARGFASKGELKRHIRTVHKLLSGRTGMLFCDERDCPRGPGGGITGFRRKDNLADHMRRKHRRTSTVSARVTSSVGNANAVLLTDVDLESPGCMDVDLAALPQKNRKRIPATGTSSQIEGLGDREEMNLRRELERMRRAERDMGNELTRRKRREEELIRELHEAQQSLFPGMDVFVDYELSTM